MALSFDLMLLVIWWFMSSDTIYALSSGQGPTGVAVIRLSGCGVEEIVKRFCGRLPAVRRASVCTLVDPIEGMPLDQALVLFFKGPHSFTGEDVAEFHVHGGRAVIEGVLSALGSMASTRMAEAGEFSRRGFENGKLDLLEVEGLADLISAETKAQKTQALAQMRGIFSALYEGWRHDLIKALAMVESALDFSDEGDVPGEIAGQSLEPVRGLFEAISAHLDDGHRGEIVRDGFRVVIVGPPNAGKSRLLNSLAQRDVAIVSDEAGTTRDVIEVRLDVFGLPVIVSDTAGLRETSSKVELEGIRRGLAQIDQAGLVLWMIDGAAPNMSLPCELEGVDVPVLRIWNKVDVAPLPADIADQVDFSISSELGVGIDQLIEHIGKRAPEAGGSGEGALITRARHRDLLVSVQEALGDFLSGDLTDVELRAEDLRRAAFALGRLTGKVDVEDILDHLFVEFCIGK